MSKDYWWEPGPGRMRIGTAAPFVYVKDTRFNRFIKRIGWSNKLGVESSGIRIIFQIVKHYVWGRSWYKVRYTPWWKIRCKFGFHQKNMYSYRADGKRARWCNWCHKRLGPHYKSISFETFLAMNSKDKIYMTIEDKKNE